MNIWVSTVINLWYALQAPDKAQSDTAMNCLDDRFWSMPRFDHIYGVCHTFNPCLGFADIVGQKCDRHTDCSVENMTGGVCRSGVCACELCASGEDCKVFEQLFPGRRGAVTITGD